MQGIRIGVALAAVALLGSAPFMGGLQAAPQQQQIPSPVAVDPPQVDFGNVAPGVKLPATFKIRNITNAPLTVASAKPSCKCTDVSPIEGKVLQPGETVELSAALQVPKTPGVKDAKVMMTFKERPGMVVASMVANVTLPINATPSYVDALKGVNKGTVVISSADGKPFRILTAGGTTPVYVGFDPTKDAPAAKYTLQWSVADYAPGTMPQWWVVETDRADCPLVPLRIRHESTGSRFDMERMARFWFPPESVVVAGRVKAGQAVELTATLEHLNPAGQGKVVNPKWSEVKSIKVPGGEGTAELVSATPRPGDFVDVVFRFTPRKDLKGVAYVPVMIETGSGSGPVFVSITVEP